MDEALLFAAQVLSPAFPTGAFAYSHGLEQVIASGQVTDADTCRDWLTQVLLHGSGRSDALLLAAAMAPKADLTALADLALASAASAERWRESVELGRSFTRAVAGLGVEMPLGLPLPIAVGAALASRNVPCQIGLALYLQGFVQNLVHVAVRLVPLGQVAAQALVQDLRPLTLDLAARSVDGDVSAISSAVFSADIATMRHEFKDVRLFRT